MVDIPKTEQRLQQIPGQLQATAELMVLKDLLHLQEMVTVDQEVQAVIADLPKMTAAEAEGAEEEALNSTQETTCISLALALDAKSAI